MHVCTFRIRVFQYIHQRAFFTVRKRLIHTYMPHRSTHGGCYFFCFQIKQVCYLLRSWFPFKLLFQLRICLADTIGKPDLIQGQSYNSRLLCQCLEYALAYPPHSIRNKFEPPGFIKSLRSLYQAYISFID